MISIAEEIVQGRRLTPEDDISALIEGNIEEVTEGADYIRKKLCSDKADLCSIVNGRAGHCPENCRFCAQSVFSHTNCDVYDMPDVEVFLEDCKQKEAEGINAYSIVTAGKNVAGKELDKLVKIYEVLRKNTKMRLCASCGLMDEEAFKRLKAAGVETYHCNIETSRNNFPNICTSHTYDDKIKEIHMAQKAGLKVCSGGIIGMGESVQDRIDMAFELYGLKIMSIPVNILIPIKGTPLENAAPLSKEEILRTVALFRYINPEAYIRIAAGRRYFEDGGACLFQSGVNAAITGNMLTTVGNNTLQDKNMLTRLGYRLDSADTL